MPICAITVSWFNDWLTENQLKIHIISSFTNTAAEFDHVIRCEASVRLQNGACGESKLRSPQSKLLNSDKVLLKQTYAQKYLKCRSERGWLGFLQPWNIKKWTKFWFTWGTIWPMDINRITSLSMDNIQCQSNLPWYMLLRTQCRTSTILQVASCHFYTDAWGGLSSTFTEQHKVLQKWKSNT